MNASWYAVKNVKDDAAEISIYDEIGLFGITAKEFTNELKGLGKRRVLLRIHSPGGEIFEGNAVYNALRRHPGGVDVAIDGLAASMASVIAMVGEKRSMAENAMFMIHNPWSVAFGDASEMRKSADLLDTLKQTIISAYAGRTGMERKKLSEMMDEESWLTAAEAHEMGFITDITEPLSAYNAFESFDISKFSKLPKNFMVKKDESKPEAKSEEAPAAKEVPPFAENKVAIDAETADFNKKIDALTAKIEELSKKHEEELARFELKYAEAKHAEAEAKLAKAYESLDRLERSYGMSAAKVVAMTPAIIGQRSIFDIYNEMPDGEAKSIFYKEHREELIKFANKSKAA